MYVYVCVYEMHENSQNTDSGYLKAVRFRWF